MLLAKNRRAAVGINHLRHYRAPTLTSNTRSLNGFTSKRACPGLSAPVRGPARHGETKPQTCPADHKKKRQPGTAAKTQGSIEEAWVTQERSKKQESTAEYGRVRQRPDRGRTMLRPDKIGGRAAGCYSPSPGCPEATRTHSGHRVPPVPGLKARRRLPDKRQSPVVRQKNA